MATAQVSDIPHSSAISMPIASKNRITSGGVGAAPTANHSHSSSPSIARILENTCSSAWRQACSSSSGTSPACLASARSRPTFIAAATAAFFSSSCSPAKPASSACLSFSQIRGTPPQSVGFTSIE